MWSRDQRDSWPANQPAANSLFDLPVVHHLLDQAHSTLTPSTGVQRLGLPKPFGCFGPNEHGRETHGLSHWRNDAGERQEPFTGRIRSRPLFDMCLAMKSNQQLVSSTALK